MAMANYKKAEPEIRLAFMIGYLCGAGVSSQMRGKGPNAFRRWLVSRHKEVDSLCAEFDEALLRDVAVHLATFQAKKAAQKN
jgi:hypothetical protein